MADNLTGQLQFAEGTYRINVGDVLSVNIYNQPDLSGGDILVRSDGSASFNGVGEIQVAGKTIREATLLLDSQIRELVREPRVTLTVSESKPPSVYLAGAVMRPGLLQAGTSAPILNSSNSVMQAAFSGSGSRGGSSMSANHMDFRLSSVLASSGGVKLSADLANITISRDGQLYKTVNLWKLLKEGSADNDIMLQNGDSVYIPELPFQALDDETYRLLLSSAIGPQLFPVRIIGDVKTPGVYDLNSASPFLNSAIAKGGGFNYGANIKVVAIRRFTGENKFNTLYIDPNHHDFLLRPNDVIYVSEQKVYKAGRFADNASKILSPFTSASSVLFGLTLLRGVN
jgi:polysaccharide export outer membrane protein